MPDREPRDITKTQEFFLGELSAKIRMLDDVVSPFSKLIIEHGSQLTEGKAEFKKINDSILSLDGNMKALADEFHACRRDRINDLDCGVTNEKKQSQGPAMVINVPRMDMDWKIVLKVALWVAGAVLTFFGIKTSIGGQL